MSSSSLNIAVIGAGAIGLNHLENFQQHPDARIVALAETSPERGREAADKFGVPELVTDYSTLLERDDIDVFSIALPNFLHAPVTLAALRAGKHVMLDKPMATNAAEATELAAEAERQGKVLMVGQNNRFTPEVQTAKQLIADGVLGEVYHAKTAWTRRAGIPKIGSWFTQRKFAGGGCCYDIGVHALDRCLYLMGEFDAVSVTGQTYAKFGPRGLGQGNWGKSEADPHATFDVDDLAVAFIKLRSGRTVLLEASWAAHQPDPDFNGTQLFGTEAGVQFPPLRLFRHGEHGYRTELVDSTTPLADPNRMVHFVDVVLGRAEPYVKVAESVAVQRILDAIYQSTASGREVRLDETPVTPS
ncbi:Gfo/Idh/MocA family protein [Synoicihabitans lomoniglobus]|uniref:Gfo/Idh/MocA family oxidoreductase n=1 Tax=Synoicihabitans lomoniglobus TaxID=2909285 RepID=A0AAF0CME6_9BACT|nr:Gfo/Idh/MocA family oxidoreductase [Opitutaceae bacterium LMO-M01]WED63171.1 Gfo/Idh/MocA family oxidoreductase [Opitutaceae bacterium LMO-M01]